MDEIEGYQEYAPYCGITKCSQCDCNVDTGGKEPNHSPVFDDPTFRGGILCWQGCYAAFCDECVKTDAWCDKCQTQCKSCANRHAREHPRAGFACPIMGCRGIAHFSNQSRKCGDKYCRDQSCFCRTITIWHCSDCDHDWETCSGDLVKRAV